MRAGDYMTAAVDILSISEVSYVDQVFGYLGMRQVANSLSNGKHPEILSAAPRPPVTHHLPPQPPPSGAEQGPKPGRDDAAPD